MDSEVREVSFEEALAEEGQQDQKAAPVPTEESRPRPAPGAPEPTPESPTIKTVDKLGGIPEKTESEIEHAQEDVDEELEALAPPVAEKEWKFGEGEFQKTYYQCELSVIGSAQWFKLLGEFLDEAMSGDHALSLNSLLSPPSPRTPGQLSVADFQDADMFIHALGKLLTVMPEFLEKSICIWLDVPNYEWDLVREIMQRSPSKGGMSHDMFEEILATFIDQNYAEIDRFFRDRFPRLRNHWMARAKEASQSRSQKR